MKQEKDVKRLKNEADFYGSMDGASKFVKGDAIARIIIVIINIIVWINYWDGANGYVLLVKQLILFIDLTVGDGLVTQIPALLISTATGIVVTRAASRRKS